MNANNASSEFGGWVDLTQNPVKQIESRYFDVNDRVVVYSVYMDKEKSEQWDCEPYHPFKTYKQALDKYYELREADPDGFEPVIEKMSYSPSELNHLMNGIWQVGIFDCWNQERGAIYKQNLDRKQGVEACAACWVDYIIDPDNLSEEKVDYIIDPGNLSEENWDCEWYVGRGIAHLERILDVGERYRMISLFNRHGAPSDPFGTQDWQTPIYTVFHGVFKERLGYNHFYAPGSEILPAFQNMANIEMETIGIAQLESPAGGG